jgi:hypothetical protein
VTLAMFVKANFWAGLVGTVAFTPFAYVYELVSVGLDSPLLKFGLLDVTMLVLAPLLMAVGFAATAFISFPFVRYLERRGVLSLTDPRRTETGDA